MSLFHGIISKLETDELDNLDNVVFLDVIFKDFGFSQWKVS